MTTLLEAWLEVLLLLLTFVRCQDLHGVSGAIGLGIEVSDSDIDDAVRSAGPKSADQDVSSVFIPVFALTGYCGLAGIRGLFFLCGGVTGVYTGFVTNR
jgi:hypothetical protein